MEPYLLERFWDYVPFASEYDCWEWQGGRKDTGYGMFHPYPGSTRTAMVHRLSWELHYGPIPLGLLVCHSCDNPPCLNPNHLFLGTVRDNVRDMISKGRGAQLVHPKGWMGGGRGTALPQSKLNPDLVRTIRARNASGESQSAIARSLGLGQPTISDIIRGVTWKHVEHNGTNSGTTRSVSRETIGST